MLASEQVEAMRAKLASSKLPLPLPPPNARTPPRRIDAIPRPVLALQGFVPAATSYTRYKTPATAGTVRLTFDYGGEIVARAGPRASVGCAPAR